jgi:3-aminobutyryl-CoA ammonia-lyase
MQQYTSTIRVRMRASDAHYGGNLVNGAHVLSLFGDVATELAILCDGDEGLLAGYEKVELLAPIYAGDFIEATGHITRMGRTSRTIEFEARKVIQPRPDISDSAADVLPTPIIVARAVGTTVVKKTLQRIPHPAEGEEQRS